MIEREMQSKSFSPELIDAEYRKLGHKLGWRLLTCPEQNIETARVALITINPGGHAYEKPIWSVEAGSAYVIESWKNRPPGRENLQQQVRRMFEIMNVQPEAVLSGYLVPFRSPRWQALPEKTASFNFGIKIWQEILKISQAETIVTFGKDIGPRMASLLAATKIAEHPAKWGDQTIDLYQFGGSKKLMVLPHLSTFKLFSGLKYETAFRAALGEI